MKYAAVFLLLLSLVGCANPPIYYIAKAYDSADNCQFKNHPEGWMPPSYCGASRGHVISVQQRTNGQYLVNKY